MSMTEQIPMRNVPAAGVAVAQECRHNPATGSCQHQPWCRINDECNQHFNALGVGVAQPPGDTPFPMNVYLRDTEELTAFIRQHTAGVGVVQAWQHEDAPERVISAIQKASALRDGGASAASVKGYSVPLTAALGVGVPHDR